VLFVLAFQDNSNSDGEGSTIKRNDGKYFNNHAVRYIIDTAVRSSILAQYCFGYHKV
jgi:hypothetical protein